MKNTIQKNLGATSALVPPQCLTTPVTPTLRAANCAGYSAQKQSGFTLIELLVVVLIIGILAAVALPQYQKAVHKSHGVEALVAADTLAKGVESYYMANGTYAGLNNSNALDIQMPKLKYFRYSQVGCNPHGATGEFNGLRVESDIDSAHITFALDLDTNDYHLWVPSLSVVFKDGKTTVRCDGGKKCQEYFGCESTEYECYIKK